jgi:hypothetical protein
MNLILGVFLVITNGSIDAAHAVAAFPDDATCRAGLKPIVAEVESKIPKGSTVVGACVDFSDAAPAPKSKPEPKPSSDRRVQQQITEL